MDEIMKELDVSSQFYFVSVATELFQSHGGFFYRWHWGYDIVVHSSLSDNCVELQ